MKNKSIVMKILIIGSFLLFLLLLVVIFSLVKMIVPKKEKVETKTIISKNYSLTDIENITFDFKKSNANFIATDNNELLIVQNSKEEKFYLNDKKKGNKYSFEEDSYLINPQKKKYTIYIPQSYLNKVSITNGFGKINITGITNDIEINNNSGNIIIKESRNIKIKDVSGNLSFENIKGVIDASTSTGNIIVSNIEGIINADTITGNIVVTHFNINGDSSFENVSGDIELGMVENPICKIIYSNENGKNKITENICNSEINIIDIKNITGMIKIY